MQGRTENAARLLADCRESAANGSPNVRAAWTGMWTRWVIDTERWQDAANVHLEQGNQVSGTVSGATPSLDVDFLIGFAAARSNNTELARAAAARVAKARASIEAAPRQPGDESMRRRARILDLELRAHRHGTVELLAQPDHRTPAHGRLSFKRLVLRGPGLDELGLRRGRSPMREHTL
jgi:hypothetical protein